LLLVRFVGGTPDHGGERILLGKHIQPAQPNRALTSDKVLPFSRPPRHQAVHRGQVPINRIAVSADLDLFPGDPNSTEKDQMYGGIVAVRKRGGRDPSYEG